MSQTEHITIAATPRVRLSERQVNVTPTDLRQARFASKLRGYDPAEVAAFLEEAADGFEQTLRENDQLRKDIVQLEASVTQSRELESGLKNMLLSAQKVAEDMRQTAAAEAERIIRDAEGRTTLMLQKTEAELETLTLEIERLKLKRREAEAVIEATVSTLQNTLKVVRDPERHDERLLLVG